MQSVGVSACDSPDLKEQMRHAVGGKGQKFPYLRSQIR